MHGSQTLSVPPQPHYGGAASPSTASERATIHSTLDAVDTNFDSCLSVADLILAKLEAMDGSKVPTPGAPQPTVLPMSLKAGILHNKSMMLLQLLQRINESLGG